MISTSINEFIVIYIITHVVAVARFRDATYHVLEGERISSVIIEKFWSSTQQLIVFMQYNPGTANECKKLLYHTTKN